MKTLLLIAALCACSLTAHAQTAPKKSDFFKPYGKGFIASSATYWAGSISDTYETRRCLQNKTCTEKSGAARALFLSKGKLNVPRVIAFDAGVYAATFLIERKLPKLASILRFALGGGHFVAGSRNW